MLIHVTDGFVNLSQVARIRFKKVDGDLAAFVTYNASNLGTYTTADGMGYHEEFKGRDAFRLQQVLQQQALSDLGGLFREKKIIDKAVESVKPTHITDPAE